MLNFNLKILTNRIAFGQYFENKLLEYFDKNNLNIKNISLNKPYCWYDYVKVSKDCIKIIELKSIQTSNKNNSTIYLVSKHKVDKYKIMKKKYSNLEFYFIYNEVSTQDKYDFFIYKIDINAIYNCYITTMPDNSQYYEVLRTDFLVLKDNLQMLF
jgi:hypothetical protein